MKKIAILAALAMAATTSFGAISIGWSNYGFLSGADPLEKTYATQDGVKLLWELVYTSSDVATPTYNKSTDQINYGAGTEVLSSRLWEKGSEYWNVTDKVEPPADQASASQLKINTAYASIKQGSPSYMNLEYTKSTGGLYSAVFQYLEDGTIYYALTDLNSSINWAATAMSESDKVHFGNAKKDVVLKELLWAPTPIPEPATMSLLGLGALGMMIRRKLRK